MCHIAFQDDKGRHCIPTACWRIGGHLYIHGSNGSRMLKPLPQDTVVCVTGSHPDGLVLARSAVNHTMNYRSAMIYGQFDKVADIGQQSAAMHALMKKPAPGCLAHVRGGSAKEYAATTVLRIAPDECAVKQRTGGPLDDAGDMAHDVWTANCPSRTAVARPSPLRSTPARCPPTQPHGHWNPLDPCARLPDDRR